MEAAKSGGGAAMAAPATESLRPEQIVPGQWYKRREGGLHARVLAARDDRVLFRATWTGSRGEHVINILFRPVGVFCADYLPQRSAR